MHNASLRRVRGTPPFALGVSPFASEVLGFLKPRLLAEPRLPGFPIFKKTAYQGFPFPDTYPVPHS